MAKTRDAIIRTAEKLFFKQGYSGTSLNDVMQETNLTKAAFFHHFKSKEDLAFAVLENWADIDDNLIKEFTERAEKLGDNPLQELTLLIKILEDWFTNLENPPGGCLFASFTYAGESLSPAMHEFVQKRLKIWIGLLQKPIDRLVASNKPISEHITAQSLTEMLATIFQGGLLLTRALDDRAFLTRQLADFRKNLPLFFHESHSIK